MNKLVYLFLFISIFTNGQNNIKIDGFFDDWTSIENTYFDSEFDSESTELINFSVSNNHEYLFVKIKLGNEIDLTEAYVNPAKLFIYIEWSCGFF